MKPHALNLAAALLGLLLLAACGPWLVHELRTLPRGAALASRSRGRIATLEVGGMHCQACVAAIRTQIAAVPGVRAVEVRRARRARWAGCPRGQPAGSPGPGGLTTNRR